MNIEIGHKAFVEIEGAWKEFTSDQTWEGVRALKNVLQRAMMGKEPDPQADGFPSTPLTVEDDIVKAAREQTEKPVNISDDVAFLLTEFPRLIASQIACADEGSKAVRKLFRNHESRIDRFNRRISGLCKCFGRAHSSSLNEAVKALERKVEELKKENKGLWKEVAGCVKDDPERLRYATEWREDMLERLCAVEESCITDNRRLNTLETKPQPKDRVARDKDGHPLVLGVSVIQGEDDQGGIFHHQEARFPCPTFGYWGGLELRPSFSGDRTPSSIDRAKVTWVFDLPFPQDSRMGRLPGSSKGGEGKDKDNHSLIPGDVISAIRPHEPDDTKRKMWGIFCWQNDGKVTTAHWQDYSGAFRSCVDWTEQPVTFEFRPIFPLLNKAGGGQ